MKNKMFKQFDFNINKIRNYCYKSQNEYKNENESSSTSLENEDIKSEKENEEKENSILKNPSETTYEIPFIKIFKEEDIKKKDKEELKYNDYERNNKENEKFFIPVKKIRKRIEENKIPPNEKLNSNMNNINQVFPGMNKNEYNSDNIFNLQNNSNNIFDFFKINEEEQKYNQLLQNGLMSLLNNENVNNYLLTMLLNSGINNYDSFNYYNQFNLLNNNINCFENNIDDSYLSNNNIINFLQAQNNINNISIINNPEEYTIILKSKTDEPSIEKITKIEVTTSFIKHSSKASQEINENSKNENIDNIINLNDIINGKENRTVVRLEPIPQHYSSFDLCNLLECYLKRESGKNQKIYKDLYVPLCKTIGKNLGYCLVMMVKPKYVIDFYNVFNGKIFEKKICEKPCRVTWADIQGEELLNPTEDDPLGSL